VSAGERPLGRGPARSSGANDCSKSWCPRFESGFRHHRNFLRTGSFSCQYTLITFGHPCRVTDLFGGAGRELLDRFEIPPPWRSTLDASLELIGDLEGQTETIDKQLRALSASTATCRC
jgi:hypothetical protein